MYWNNQFSIYIIGSSSAGATLTNSYNGNTHTDDVKGYKIVTLYIEYTPAENDSDCFIQIEAGPDTANLFPKVALIDESAIGESTAKGHVFKLEATAAGTAVKRRLLIETADLKLRVSAKETTGGSYGTIKVILCRNEQLTR